MYEQNRSTANVVEHGPFVWLFHMNNRKECTASGQLEENVTNERAMSTGELSVMRAVQHIDRVR